MYICNFLTLGDMILILLDFRSWLIFSPNFPHSCMPSPLALDPIRVQSRVCCQFGTNRNSNVYLSIYLIIQLELWFLHSALSVNGNIFTSTAETIVPKGFFSMSGIRIKISKEKYYNIKKQKIAKFLNSYFFATWRCRILIFQT